jgi:hypothetical protein
MLFYFKNKSGKDVMRLTTRLQMDERTLDHYRRMGYEQVDHAEFVKLRKLIRTKGCFPVEPLLEDPECRDDYHHSKYMEPDSEERT